ncbi:alkylation response protein AidB-like acyl-CoA dehydrogenase [Arthrobacter sp. CAN_A214]|uniref:acyl-CoA dehydrogenase n=1 Tax=Arthrobacter sp. CAN_A214 TaxID=2787720 RepID=UPI0018CB0B03
MTATATAAALPTDQDLLARFGPLFDHIATGSALREVQRKLPSTEVESLKTAGFGALRIPQDRGGLGASLPQLFLLLTNLAAADSNLAQLWRGHFAFVEGLLLDDGGPRAERWFPVIAGGAMIGNASSELTGASLKDISTTISAVDGDLLLEGTKYYSTGSIYADWIAGSAISDGERVSYAVAAGAPGVECLDDWNGFGQRLTGSGTTVFRSVRVDPADVRPFNKSQPSHVHAFFQLVLVASLAGIARAATDDVVAFVAPRTRTYANATSSVPAGDPQVQQVIGEVSSLAFSAEASVSAAARALGKAFGVLTEATGPGVRRDAVDEAELAVYQAQVTVIDQVLSATSRLFEVGGASAVSIERGLDRHWRNARTIASHNPAIYKARSVGGWELTGELDRFNT